MSDMQKTHIKTKKHSINKQQTFIPLYSKSSTPTSKNSFSATGMTYLIPMKLRKHSANLTSRTANKALWRLPMPWQPCWRRLSTFGSHDAGTANKVLRIRKTDCARSPWRSRHLPAVYIWLPGTFWSLKSVSFVWNDVTWKMHVLLSRWIGKDSEGRSWDVERQTHETG